MRYTTTDGPKKPLNAIQEGSLGDKMGIADYYPWCSGGSHSSAPDHRQPGPLRLLKLAEVRWQSDNQNGHCLATY